MITNLIALLCVITLMFNASNSAAATEPLRVGVVPQFELRRINTIWTPLLERLGRDTGLSFQLDIAPSIPAFEQSLNAGQYDLAYMNPYQFIVAHKRQGYEALVRDHGADLSGIIVVAVDSPITSVAMLDGKTIAFPSPNAMGAALLPRAELARKFHVNITEKYVRTHSSVYLSVALGTVDAGAGILSTFELLEPQIKSRLRILHETGHTPPHPFAAHPRVPAALHHRIALAFVALAAEPTGAELLAEVPMKRAGPAQSDDYAGLSRLGLQDFYVDQ